MSDKCPDKVKAAWAFRVYGTLKTRPRFHAHFIEFVTDYDDDGVVSERDISRVIDQLTSGTDPSRVLEPEEKEKIARVVRKEKQEILGVLIYCLIFSGVVARRNGYSINWWYRANGI